MTKFKKNFTKSLSILTAVSFSLVFLTGCASYNASTLNDLVFVTAGSKPDEVVIASKAFSQSDCKKYLDRDVLSAGYQPVQVFIQNNTNKTFLFSPTGVSLPHAQPEEVAEKVHTSTVGRAAAYGTAAVLTFGLFAIPAVVDGVGSSNANDALDHDFSAKAAREQLIYPHARLNMLLFVPRESYQDTFSITLIDPETQVPKTLQVTARQ